MDVKYKNTKTARLFAFGRTLVKYHGARRAGLIQERIRALQTALNLGDFLPPYNPPERCHELKMDRDGQFSMDLDHPYRLIFEPNHNPVPTLRTAARTGGPLHQSLFWEWRTPMSNNGLIPHEPDYATPPGQVIGGYMEAYGVNKETLGREAGLDPETTDRFLAGGHPVTPEIAAALARLFPRPARFWENMETLYQSDKKRLATRCGKRPGAGRKPNPPRRYSISLPNALGRDLDARAKAAGITSYRWILNAVKRSLEAQ